MPQVGNALGQGGADEADELNTWRLGFRRLFLGFALPDGVALYRGTAPLEGPEGAEAVLLGALKTLLDRLGEFADLCARDHSPAQWRLHLTRTLDLLLQADDDNSALDAVREALERLDRVAAEAHWGEPLHRQVVRHWLESELGAAGAQHRYAAGKVTFCAMVPMRAVPFRVVALLGLNDRDFPRRARRPGFDLMAGDYRPGDRSVRDEDRHLFLEALLSARDALLLSYVGNDVRDNSALQPALPLSELMDYIDAGFEMEQPLLVRHPLQPFSRRYGAGESGVLTYAAEWERAADGAGDPAPFCPRSLDEPEEEFRNVRLDQLESFYNHPSRFFLRERLGVRFDDLDDSPEDDEAFALAPFPDLYQMRQEFLGALLAGEDYDDRAELYRLRGALPRGRFGQRSLEAEREALETMADGLRDYAPMPALEVDLALGGLRLQGWLGGVSADALVTYRVNPLNGKDLTRLWLRHLVLNSLDYADVPRVSRHLYPEGAIELAPFDRPEQARECLTALLEHYWEGLCRPLPYFPRSAYAYAGQMAKNGDPDAALQRALAKWRGKEYSGGEREDPYHQAAFRGVEPVGEEFAALAVELLLAALERAEFD